MDVEIRPEPDHREREALLAALRGESVRDAPPYWSAWRAAADDEADGYEVKSRVDTRARPAIAHGHPRRARRS